MAKILKGNQIHPDHLYILSSSDDAVGIGELIPVMGKHIDKICFGDDDEEREELDQDNWVHTIESDYTKDEKIYFFRILSILDVTEYHDPEVTDPNGGD